MPRTIQFTIQQGDITTFNAEVIALKYAQSFYGADLRVMKQLQDVGIPADGLQPTPGTYRFMSAQGGVRAQNVLFIGVPPLSKYKYADIRQFMPTLLQIITERTPSIRHVATTVQGAARRQLDEIESLLSQVAGVLDAVQADNMPPALEEITLVEIEPQKVARFRQATDDNLAKVPYATPLKSEWGYALEVGDGIEKPQLTPALESAGAGSDAKPHIFVAMPFRRDMDDVFYYGIQGPARMTGFLCERVDHDAFFGDILEEVKHRIETAAVVIADLTHANPNVYLEVGYAWGREVPVILLAHEEEQLLFDVRTQRCLTYDRIRDLETALLKELSGLRNKGLI